MPIFSQIILFVIYRKKKFLVVPIFLRITLIFEIIAHPPLAINMGIHKVIMSYLVPIFIIIILNIIVYKDFSLEKGLFWLRNLIMYKYKIFSHIFHDTGIAEW